jgi:hypothetical protein
VSKSKNTIRFGLGNPETGVLTTWRLWVSGNETYLSVRIFTGSMKLSLHSGGRWSLRLSNKQGFTVDHPPPFEEGLLQGPTIIYPGGLIREPLPGMPIDEGVDVYWFDPPQSLEKRLFIPVIAKPYWAKEYIRRKIGFNNELLGPLVHRNNDQVWLASLIMPLEPEEIADFRGIKDKISVNIKGDPEGIYAPHAIMARTSPKNEIFLISLILGRENINIEDD